MTLCFLAWGFFYAVMVRRLHTNFSSGFLITTGYYLAFAAIISILFWPDLRPVLAHAALFPIVSIMVFGVAVLAVHAVAPLFLREPIEYFERYPDRHFLQLGWRRFFAKSADIFAQQAFIVVLVMLLQRLGLPLPLIIIAFGVLFMALHIPLIVSEWGAWPAWLFASIVAVFSAIFPVLILLVPYGFLYNIELHWLFYLTTAMVFWLQYDAILTRKRTARGCAYAAAPILIITLAALFMGAYNVALLSLLFVVVLMEVRVRLGLRLPRGLLFYVHVSSGALLILALGMLVYQRLHGFLPELLFLFLVMSATGGLLLLRTVLHEETLIATV